jgi:hypothetical protein
VSTSARLWRRAYVCWRTDAIAGSAYIQAGRERAQKHIVLAMFNGLSCNACSLSFSLNGVRQMLIRTGFFCAAMGIAAFIAPTPGNARVYLDVNVAPPDARVEVVPAARVGYAWAPGYYNYSGHRHVWVGGRYIRQRQGNHWVADRWEQHGDRWRHERGRWDHD